jgi:tetratricopeptide (TPR) repeat protein
MLSQHDRDLAEVKAAIRRGDQNLATDLAAAALQRGLQHPLVFLLVAERLEKESRGGQALDLLKKATTVVPDDAELWRRFAEMLARQGMLADSIGAFDAALAIEPDAYLALIAAGAASYQMGNLKAAYGYYRRAADLKPDEAELLSTLALIAARRQEPKEARALAERALVLQPDSTTAQLALGRADLLEGFPDVARARMTRLIGRRDLSNQNRVNILDIRAEAFDLLDRPTEAFADYEARNTILEGISAPRIKRELRERRVDQARRLAAYFASAPAEPWSAGAGEDAEGARASRHHVFLLGFPRSGTTLLEKVLSSHPSVVTLEEIDHLAPTGSHFLNSEAELNGLATLTTAAAETCRQNYWRGVRKSLGEAISDRVLVDKLPLHTIALPVIAKLFPDAKILFALRDPRDVVLSCFRRRFIINSAMYEFLTLDGAARYYDQVMTLAKIYRTLLPLDIHEVRHEAMVADFADEVRKILSFIGVDWDAAVKDFAERTRGVPRTPSDIQLARGLNADGVGQWRRYERQLAPVLKILEPWASHFGYPAAGSAAPSRSKSQKLREVMSKLLN